MKAKRSDLIIEAEGIEAGGIGQGEEGIKAGAVPEGILVKEEWNKEGSMKITVVKIRNEEGARAMGRSVGNYITLEFPQLLKEEEALKHVAEEELSKQLRQLLHGKKSDTVLVVGLGNREVTADAVGPLTIDKIMITGCFFKDCGRKENRSIRRVCAFVPGVMAQTGMETVELIRGVVEKTRPDVVVAVDALAARSPERLNTTIQLTDTGIHPGAGVGNNRKELNEGSLGCPVIAIGVPTVLDAVTIAREEFSKEVEALFVMPRNIDSSVRYVSEILAGGINCVHQKEGI